MKHRGVLVLILIAIIVGYPLATGYQVWRSSHVDEVHSADAIVVLGAAQYNGVPSPVFKARLDQAAYLYREGLSESVIVTGGKLPGDSFTEAGAGEQYLISEGVPEDAIQGEDEGTTTWESLTRVRALTEGEVDSVLFVSDPMHSERIKRMASDLGFGRVYTSPASYVGLNRSRETKAKELAREVASILAYQLLER
ncbi:MAG TPA: YdcF family protein [Actinomycetota bacterium]|nr:YdcF family protein [Actinomycetota bacterium]